MRTHFVSGLVFLISQALQPSFAHAAEPGRFTPGQTLAGNVAAPGEVCVFRFDAVAGTTFDATAQAGGGLLLVLRVLADEDGAVLAATGVPAESANLDDILLPATGSYRVEVGGGASGTVGGFDVLTKAKLPKSAYGGTWSNTAEVTFDAVAGTRMRALFSPYEGPLLAGPEGAVSIPTQPVAGDRTKVPWFRLGSTGTYTMTLKHPLEVRIMKKAKVHLAPPKGTTAEPHWVKQKSFFPKFATDYLGLVDVNAMAVADLGDGRGPLLFIGGGYDIFKGFLAWSDGTRWEVATSFDGPIYSLASFDDGSGPALYLAGGFRHRLFDTFNGIARFRPLPFHGGSDFYIHNFEPLAGGLNDDTNPLGMALTVFDDGEGEALYVSGKFLTAGGITAGVLSPGIARWDGTWSAVGTGLDGMMGEAIVHDDGSGPGLYLSAGAPLDYASENGVWLWKQGAFSQVVADVSPGISFLSGGVGSLASFAATDGPPLLYLGGDFDALDGSPVFDLAHEAPSGWEQSWAGDGVTTPELRSVQALATFDLDGQVDGAELYAGGIFEQYGESKLALMRLAETTFVPLAVLDEQLNNPIRAMVLDDDQSGAGPALVIGGSLKGVKGKKTFRIARWYPGGPVVVASGPP